MRFSQSLLVLLLGVWLGPGSCLAADEDGNEDTHASGSGTYFVLPGVLARFEFDEDHVQCIIDRAVMPDGTVLQMFMNTTDIDSMTVDRTANRVVIKGDKMLSVTRLIFTDGNSATMTEFVPYVVDAIDNDPPGAAKDFWSLTVTYNKNAPRPRGRNQSDLFGEHPSFLGPLVSGKIEVR